MQKLFFCLIQLLILSFIAVLYFACTHMTSKNKSDVFWFNAQDGIYFPDFILDYFKGAKYFTHAYPRLNQAREGIKLIEVKPLNSNNNEYHEANLAWSYDGYYLSYEVSTLQSRKILIKNLKGNFEKEIIVTNNTTNNFLSGIVNEQFLSYNSKLSWASNKYSFVFMSNAAQGEYNIYIGNIRTSQYITINSPDKDGYASWNPNGNEIVFVSARSGNGDLYVVNVNTTNQKRLTFSEDPDLFPEWLADGKSVIYNSGSSYNNQIFIVSKKNPYLGQDWETPYKITCWDQDSIRPTGSPNGKNIAFYARNTESYLSQTKQVWSIYVINYMTNKCWTAEELTNMNIAQDIMIDLNTGPTWSPDGNKIFYVKNEPQNFNPIYVYDIIAKKRYKLQTNTKLNRDIMISSLGVLSFRAQVGPWEKVFLALTNQGKQLQNTKYKSSETTYETTK